MTTIDNRLLTVFFASQLGRDRGPRTPDELDRFVNDLVHTDWEADDQVMRLRRDLTPDQVAGSVLYDQTRIFLRTLAEDKGARLTQTGKLNRASIARFIERMAWPRRSAEHVRETYQVRTLNEMDVMPLHYVRIIAECAGLAPKRRGRVTATKVAVALCDDAQAGVLFRRLFVAFFRNLNLNYLSGFPPTPLVQDTIPIILWRLSVVANDWIATGKLPIEVFHPKVREQIRQVDSYASAESGVLLLRVLRPLCWFGLLETDTPENDTSKKFEDPKFRKTPLFDQFLSFHFQP